jgi:hypothetical protein
LAKKNANLEKLLDVTKRNFQAEKIALEEQKKKDLQHKDKTRA